MNDLLQAILDKCVGIQELQRMEKIQSLWSGYGEICRVYFEKESVVVKLIDFPEFSHHPRGWNSDRGHLRKKTSYQVESHWYKNYKDQVPGAVTPKTIGVGAIQDNQYLVLEDLKNRGFVSKAKASWGEINLCLEWLAHFHRFFLDVKPEGLWPVGTYWHLDTRPDELATMSDSELKSAATFIDAKLNQAKYKTIVHGDAKLANFLFSERAAAAVDFQYVGGGVGVKDVAYFLSSVFQAEELEKWDQRCLDHYFKFLNLPEVEEEWRKLYPLAWCDFYRFLQGWSPGHKKVHSYSKGMRDLVLSEIKIKNP